MTKQIVECVPNFSQGRDAETINAIASAISSVQGVRLLNVDVGYAANRTVYTFIGELSATLEAAFRAVEVATKLIDMRHHTGEHPRLGAVDVLPLIPISGITLEQCAHSARELAAKIAEQLGVPSYCYEAAALREERRNLANCRRGEYEALPQRINSQDDAPDFGARPFDEIIARSGAINIGAREFLVAVNFNLNTTSVDLASAIAADVRESGRPKLGQAGTLKSCKAIGWFIEEYDIAQVSMNITNISHTPLHVAYLEVCRAARERGVEVTGTEIIGLIPQHLLLEAGRFFADEELTTAQLLDLAVRSMSLDDLRPFIIADKVLTL